MKIRNGFVSNSSSSSFIIIGKADDKDHYDETIQLLKEEYNYEDDVVDIVQPNEDKLRNGYKLMLLEIEYGAEETIDNFIKDLNKQFGLQLEIIKEWD